MSVARKSTFFALGVAALLLSVIVAGPTSADAATPGVSASPHLDVMQVVDGEVLDSVVIGNRVVLVGTFTKVKNAGGGEVNQPYIAAYNIDTGLFDSSFRPAFDKAAFAVDTDGTSLFVGGNFNAVDGEAHRKLTKLSAAGNLISSFDPQVSANVNDVAIANGNVYLAGRFTSIDGQDRSGFAAVDASTGTLESAVNFDFTFSVASGGGISGKSIAITPDSSKLFLSHTARFIDGQERTAIARFDISTNAASLSSWQTNLYDDELDRFGGALRPRRIAMSPDGLYVVMVTSGGDRPPAGDTAVRFPVNSGANTDADWVSRHFDTVLGVAISGDSVFVGGHFQFQEAPGSTDPFPGDELTNYGFGFGQGPAQLGSEVVARQQLGALDPATGKSQDWNPGSDSFLGVQSLTFVPGQGLLVGHDGDRLGSEDIGKFGFFPLGDDPIVPPVDRYTCTAAFNGSTATVTFVGERGQSEQLLKNGRWVTTITGLDTTQTSGTSNDTFSVRLRGNGYDTPFTDVDCSAGDEPPVNPGTLDTTIDSPADGAVVDGGQVALSGQASAPGGIDKVRLTILRRSDFQYLTANGSFSPDWTPIDVQLDTANESATWSTTVQLDQAVEYTITAKTFAADGSKDPSNAKHSFLVGSTNDDPPVLTVTGPANPSPGNTAVIEGMVTDDLGVAGVTFTMRDRDKNLYLRSDGSLGASESFSASLSNPGARSTSFTRTLTNVPVGEWEVRVDARDTSGQRFARTRLFSQVGNTAPPAITLTNGDGQKKGANSPFDFSGVAQAEAGIESVSVLLRDVVDRSGVQASGNLGARASYFVLPDTNGGTSRNWSYTSPNLPTGTYDVFFRITDTLGAVTTARTQIVAGVIGDDLPTQAITGSLRYQQGVDSLSTSIGGTAADDNGVAQVTIGIFDFVNRVWVQTNGTTSNVLDPFLATLSSPGANSTNWTLNFTAPRSGTYYYYVRAVDSAGQAAANQTFGSSRLYPGDEPPTVTVNLPTNNQVLTTGRIAVSGSADDDNSLTGVEVLFRNLDTGQYLRSDGSMGSAQWIQAALTNPGGVRSNFDYQTPVIADGTWDVTVRSEDNNGQTASPTTRVRVTLN